MEFLNLTGGWAPFRGAGFWIDGPAPTPAEIRFVSEFWEWQDICRFLMRPTRWHSGVTFIPTEWQSEQDGQFE